MLLSAFLVLLGGYLVRYILLLILQLVSFQHFKHRHGCLRPTSFLTSSLWTNARHKFRMINESYGDLFNDHYTRRFQLYGSTYSVVDAFGRIKAIHSIDPAVVHAVLVSSSNDWTVSRGRRNALKPLAQSGVLLTDGVSISARIYL